MNQDLATNIILIALFCIAPIALTTVVYRAFKRGQVSAPTNKPTSARATLLAGTPAKSVVGPVSVSPAVVAGAGSAVTPIYLNFSNKPAAILENMNALTAQAKLTNATQARWSRGPRALFLLGLGLMLVEGVIFALGYTPSCAFATGGLVMWVIAFVLGRGLRRAQVQAFPKEFGEFEEIVHTLRDDLRPDSGFLGNLDLTGARQATKVAREAKDAANRTTQYFRDQWLSLKAKLYDGNVLRVSAIQRIKERKGYYGRGRVSGKSKWKPAKFKGSYQELKVRIVVNPDVYKIVPNKEMAHGKKFGEYTIESVDSADGIITVLANSGNENVASESILGVLKSAYGMLQMKKA